MLPLPNDATNPLQLADWLEIVALTVPDGNASRGDLERALSRHSFYELRDDESIERKILEVFQELDQRGLSAQSSYPFDVTHATVQIRSVWPEYGVYAFCLLLSYYGSSKPAPRKLFEHVARVAAKGYLQGNATDFGHPRSILPTAFPEAVSALCNLIGEGDGYSDQPSIGRKDDKLDLVAWKDFPDRLSSKLMLFGQCASGWDWEEKLTELAPKAFCDHWMRRSPASPLLSSLFTPHRVERSKWEYTARRAGIIFDRCRIAYWARPLDGELDECQFWVQDLLQSLRTTI